MLPRRFCSVVCNKNNLILLGALVFLPVPGAWAQEDAECAQSMRYTFSWSLEECRFAPRGGSSEGAPVKLDPEPHPGWQALQEDGLSDFEKDRRAILAMAGPYRTSFEFLETVGYTPDFERARPYHSWGTEYIYVAEKRPEFISLQHILVMFREGEDGELEGPFVQKHWRQDWEYEKQNLLVYAGNNTWEKNGLDEETLQGTWTQSVYQVDDSPRYQSYGEWEHHDNFSTWRGSRTWRPVPRRESSVRDDYQVLEARNRHTITHNGWVHEQENTKLRLNEQGEPVAENPYLAKEIGVNRYERIVDFDFSAGDQYWESTSSFWRDVRQVWEGVIDSSQRLRIADEHEGTPLFAALFRLAEQHRSGGAPAPEENRSEVRDILENYITRP